MVELRNPFRPGAGHMPPFLAGRQQETDQFRKLLKQEVVLDNVILTGLRGTGKTVLMDTWKPIAQSDSWGWVGTDLSEAASLSEERISIRLITDLSVLTSSWVLAESEHREYFAMRKTETKLDFDSLVQIFTATPGLVSDRLKAVLRAVWKAIPATGPRGIVFAYDEAQNLDDHAAKSEYPLSLLLEIFQSLQKQGAPFLLLLTGLPTLFPKLVEARTGRVNTLRHRVFEFSEQRPVSRSPSPAG